MRSAECNLLSLGEKLIDVTVELHLADIADWKDILGPDLGRIEDIEVEFILAGLWADLDAKFPGWIGTLLDCVPEVAAMEIRVISCELQSFIPDQRVHAESRRPVELHERADAFGIGKGKCVDTKTLHHAERTRDGPVTHRPHEHMRSFRMKILKIPEVIMSALGLRHLRVRLRLASVNNIWEFYGILNEENRNIISDKIPVSLLSVEFGCEPAHITNSIGASTASKDGREPDKDWSGTGCICEHWSVGDVCEALIKLERSEGARTTGMDYSFGYSFVIKVHNLILRQLTISYRRHNGLEVSSP